MSDTPTHDEVIAVSAPLPEVYASLLAHFGGEAIVRDEEDGVGRFAGIRTVVLQGRSGDRLQLLRGSWSELKKRTEEPMLTVTLSNTPQGCELKLVGEPASEPSAGQKLVSMVGDVLSIALTIGLLAYGVNTFRGLEVDWTRLAMISGGGALLYVIARQFMGDSDDDLQGSAWLRAQIKSAASAHAQADQDKHDDGAEAAAPAGADASLRATVDD